jgi:hypothetical protein
MYDLTRGTTIGALIGFTMPLWYLFVMAYVIPTIPTVGLWYDPNFYLAWIWIASVLSVFIALYYRAKKGRFTFHYWLIFGVLTLLVPIMGFVVFILMALGLTTFKSLAEFFESKS